MFKDLKIDMPAVIASVIMAYFGTALIMDLIHNGAASTDLKQTLVNLVMLAAGYYLGSSASSAKKDAPLIAAATKNGDSHGS